MYTDKFHGRKDRGRRPFRRKGNRHPGFAEHDEPREVPVPKGEIPAAFANNAFGQLNPLLQHAIAEVGYLNPTPIQEQSIPVLLTGKDLLGGAQTGTGKTAAFLLPILHRLLANQKETVPKHPRSLILAPTRELAAQIAKCCSDYGKFVNIRYAVVFGGVSQNPQVRAMQNGADIVIATPGRLFDLMEQKYVFLDLIEEFVLDEADRMLDMGFLPDIKKVIAHLPEQRHSQFFSATLNREVRRLAATLVKDPVTITISPEAPTVDRINQRLMFVDRGNKGSLLTYLLQTHPEYDKVLVFTRTRYGADKVVKRLHEDEIRAEAIHSNKSQMQRTRALENFRNGKVRVLVATDIASRGIDVDSISHVVNYDLPEEDESYIHRIGRTARAGASGAAISFVSSEERGFLRSIERMIKKEIEIDRDQPYHSEKAEIAAGKGGNAPEPAWKKTKGHSDRQERGAKRPSKRGLKQTDFGKKSEAEEMLESDNQYVNRNQEAPADEATVSAPEAQSVVSENAADVPVVPAAESGESKATETPVDVAKTDADLVAETPSPAAPKPVAPVAGGGADATPWYAKPYRSGGHHLPEDKKPEKKQRRKEKQEDAPFREDLDIDREQRRRARSFEKRGDRRDRPDRREKRRERFFDEDDRFPAEDDDMRSGHVMTAEERAKRSWLGKDWEGERSERPRRHDGGDRGRPRFGGGRPPHRFDGDDRPPRFGGDRKPRRFDDRDGGGFGGDRDSFRKPRRFDDDGPRFGGGRPPRRFDDDRPPRFGGDRRPRRFDDRDEGGFGGDRRERDSFRKPRRFDDDGSRFGGGRAPRRFDDDRPPRFGGDRRPRRFDDRDDGGFGGDRGDRDSFRRPRRPGGDGPRFGGGGGFRSKNRKSRDGEFRKRGGFNSHRRNNRPKK
ncbi:MAG: DEAD/DEAH box helicase [Kiritimatiellae bacterium]|nr:DEAD/DEAH box helicase [Kiritimatiellia bacterium]